MRDPNGPGRDVGAGDTALMGQGARPAARTSGPFGSVFWPAELLERVLPETLALAAARLDGIGRCAVCRTTLGAAPWAALTAAAAGPFGAWTVQGHLAHPDCVNEGAALWQMAGESTLPEPTTVVGLAHHHIAGSEAEPVITVRPSVDAFHFGVGPRSAQVVDPVLQRYAQLGWEQPPDGAECTAAAPPAKSTSTRPFSPARHKAMPSASASRYSPVGGGAFNRCRPERAANSGVAASASAVK